MTLSVQWIDHGREPQCKPNPSYPDGVRVDLRESPDQASCEIALPYPARRCGYYFVACDVCGTNALITTAGRPDDPNHVIMPCKDFLTGAALPVRR